MVKVKETKVSYRARLKDGQGKDGKDKFAYINFANIRPDAADQDVHEVVRAILGLQEKEVDAIFKLENKELEDAQ
ncbi:MAG: DUF1659 domain-containing protein [Peptostreptococcus sp.]|jgi:hypothetical protein|uniref:DUF1659 domain-containing protein n=1 Tax=Peptostreptococcus sp. TaxID=1262 RepID=UPI001CB25D2F|nr:DUF1659 domain-containing protein [Peptostreptococcus sp.]MBF1052958.1 DUF1659 domain-containing protein [Peptostreptococcus sp.]MBF1057201.1 DUF1659 domain-containing protein [Peptostreptococcus sp.]